MKEVAKPGKFAAFATWSPDGKYLTFQVQDEKTRSVWITPLEGGSPKQITKGEGEHSHPQWSPVDPDLVLFVLDHKNLCTVSISTGEIKQITDNQDADFILDYPSWSFDGEKIYYSVSRKSGDIFTLSNY